MRNRWSEVGKGQVREGTENQDATHFSPAVQLTP